MSDPKGDAELVAKLRAAEVQLRDAVDCLTASLAESREDAIASSRLYHEQRDRADALLADMMHSREEVGKLREALQAVQDGSTSDLSVTVRDAVDAALAGEEKQ